MIRGIPAWGPLPCLYFVSGLPSGCWIVKETCVCFPGLTGPEGWKPSSLNVLALPIGIVGPPPPPPPAAPAERRSERRGCEGVRDAPHSSEDTRGPAAGPQFSWGS